MRLSWEPLIRPSCSFHQFPPALLGFLGGMRVIQRGLLHCMWIIAPQPPERILLPSLVDSLSLKNTSPKCLVLFPTHPTATHVCKVRQHQMLILTWMSIIKNMLPFRIEKRSGILSESNTGIQYWEKASEECGWMVECVWVYIHPCASVCVVCAAMTLLPRCYKNVSC